MNEWLGIIIAGLIYFFWRNSSTSWRRTIANIFGAIAIVMTLLSLGSLIIYGLAK